MRKTLIAAAAIASAFLTPTTAQAATTTLGMEGHSKPVAGLPAAQQDQTYRKVAIDALSATLAMEKSGAPLDTNVLSNIARTYYGVNGWSDPNGDKYLKRVLALQHTDGGWSPSVSTADLGKESQIVSTGDHVGPLILQAYQKGKVPRSVIQRAVDFYDTRAMLPSAIPGSTGRCFTSYPAGTAIPATTNCRNNMSASSAWFVKVANSLGITASNDATGPVADKVTAKADAALVFDREQRRYGKSWAIESRDITIGGVMYPNSNRQIKDWDHNALNAIVHRELGEVAYGNESINAGWPVIGVAPGTTTVEVPAAGNNYNLTHGAHVLNYNAHLRLARYSPNGKCASSHTDAKGDLALLNSQSRTDETAILTVRYSQLAMYSSILSNACSGISN